MSAVHSAQQHPSNERPEPVALPANQPEQFYRGGAAIADLRGGGDDRTFGPEDWVASTTTRFGQARSGLSHLPDGRTLLEAVAAEPEPWLGAEHVAAFGDSTALLVKLLDAGQRLPVHCHPSDTFARQQLGSRFGKTEAWIVLGTTGPDPVVHVGFREDAAPEAVQRWVRTQDASALLGSLNEIPVRKGQTVLVPAGTPHAIGAGVFVVELQQPTDFSITLEWEGFLADAESAFLGMPHRDALEALNRSGFDDAAVSSLIRHTAERDDPRVPLLSEDASGFFRADRLHPRGALELEPSFGVLVALEGSGTLRHDGGELALRRGSTVVVPHGAGTTRLEGDLTAIHCRPPAPTT